MQEIILERIGRLPQDAHTILNLCAVIGRDFSLELFEKAAAHDPLNALDILLQRKFLIERPDERLDFSHQVVRQAVYDSLNILQRRRLHLAVAEALVEPSRSPRPAHPRVGNATIARPAPATACWRRNMACCRRAVAAHLRLSRGDRHL